MLVRLDAERMRALPLAPVDGFVLSRIDGVLSVDDLAQIMGLSLAQVLTSLQKLQQMKLVELPQTPSPGAPRTFPGPMRIAPAPAVAGSSPAPSRDSRPPRGMQNSPPQSSREPSRESGKERAAAPRSQTISEGPKPRPQSAPLSSSQASPAPPSPPRETAKSEKAPPNEGALTTPEEGVEIEADHQRLIQDLFDRLADLTHYEVLGVPRTSDKKAIKRAYFELASKFHPDKFFRKNLGSFRLKMEAIFRNVTEAHDVLTVKAQRAEYDAYLASLEKTRGMEAMLEDAMAEVKRAEDAARASVPSSTPPTASPSARLAPSVPAPTSSAPAQARPSGVSVVVPSAPSSRPQSPNIASTPAAPISSPNLGAFIADALGSPTPKAPTETQPRVPTPARISVRPDAQTADAQARREMLARRLTGALGPRVPAAPKVPAVQFATPTDAVDALKRRYEDKVGAARASQAKKYADIGAAARATNDHVAAANAYRVAVSFAADDEELKRAAEETQRASDAILSDAYFKQAQYEERSEHWAEAAKSWGRVTRARPTDAKAHEHAAQCIVKANGNLHEAAAFAQRAVALTPQHVPARMTLANVYLAAGLALNAKRELEVAAQLAPDDAAVQALLKRVAKGGA